MSDHDKTYSFLLIVGDRSLFSTDVVNVTISLPDNSAPVINDQTFTIAENSANGTVVGTVVASDPEGQNLSYSITSGNTNNTFAINSGTGQLTVADSSFLDFEVNPAYTLIIEVSDGSLNSSADVTINLTDVDDDITGVEGDLAVSIKIFPNPAKDYVLVESEKFIFESVIKLFDISGKPVDHAVYKTDIKSYKIELTGLYAGIYILLIECNGETTTKRVFKK